MCSDSLGAGRAWFYHGRLELRAGEHVVVDERAADEHAVSRGHGPFQLQQERCNERGQHCAGGDHRQRMQCRRIRHNGASSTATIFHDYGSEGMQRRLRREERLRTHRWCYRNRVQIYPVARLLLGGANTAAAIAALREGTSVTRATTAAMRTR